MGCLGVATITVTITLVVTITIIVIIATVDMGQLVGTFLAFEGNEVPAQEYGSTSELNW